MEDEVHFGTLNHFKQGLGKKWNKRWAVLYKHTIHGLRRIELYDNKEHFERRDRNSKKHVTVVPLENCSNIVDDAMNDGKKAIENVIKLEFFKDEKQQIFSCDTSDEMSKWYRAFCSVVLHNDENQDHNTTVFNVEIRPSEVTQKLNLRGYYLLSVSPDDIALLDLHTKQILYKWPLHLLRKYGRDRQEFSLEAGRRCVTGPGMFYFTTDQYNVIFQEVETHVKSRASNRPRSESTTSTSSLSRSGISNQFQRAPDPIKPANTLSSIASVYDNPLDAKKDRPNNPDDTYTYSDPVDVQAPPSAKQRSTGKGKKSETQGGKKPKIPGPSKGKSNVVPAKPPRLHSKSSGPEVIAEATYADPLDNSTNSIADEYSHLNISGVSVPDAEYDSIQFNNGSMPSADEAYASTSHAAGYEGKHEVQDMVYDHVQR